MKAKKPLNSPTSISNISFGKTGVGPDNERFIEVKIKSGKKPVENLLRYDEIFGGGKTAAIAKLNRQGAHLISPKVVNQFLHDLQELGPQEPSFKVATRVGPFGDAFVLPETVVSVTSEKVPVVFDEKLNNYLTWGRTGGTLEGWREFEKLAAGNSRLILALGQGFVGPLRMIIPIEPFAVQVTAKGGTGKSTLGSCASSIWGQRLRGEQPHDLCGGDTWKNTVANMERVLAARYFTHLFLNETHHIEADKLVDTVFLICEGQGTGRYTETGRWESFVPVFSTSNKSAVEIAREAKEAVDRAFFDRLIDVPPPRAGFGFFENLHGCTNRKEFCVRLKGIYDANFGVVGRAYVLRILNGLAKDKEKLASWIKARRDIFTKLARKMVSANPDHERVIGHFSSIYAALRLARKYRLFVLEKGPTQEALLTCLRDHLAFTDETIVTALNPLERLKAYVRENRSRFIDLDKQEVPKEHDHKNCPGYIYRKKGRTWIALPESVVEQVVGGWAVRELKNDLDRLGVIRKTGSKKRGRKWSNEGRNSRRYAVKIGIAHEWREYCCVIDASFFDS